MLHLVDATRQAVEQNNWYAALSLALTLPDICGRIANPGLRKASEKRVVVWFDKYLALKYGSFLKGGDFYALRCAYLHQGEFSLQGQSARKVLDRIHLTAPNGGFIHNNLFVHQDAKGVTNSTTLQLSVDHFCEEICEAVEQWLKDVADDFRIQSELSTLGKLAIDINF